MAYKLIYFPVRGRGMHIRYICADLDLNLEFEKVTNNWAEIKPTTLLGQLPVFKDGDFELAQSNAILRYLARKHGLYGSNDREAALIDMINDQQEDLRVSYIRLIYREYETGKDAFVTALPGNLGSLEKVLTKNKGGDGFFVGDKISFVDYSVFDLLDNLQVLSPTCLDTLPKLKAFHQRMASRTKLAAFRSTDEFKNTPINGNGKQ